MTTEDMLVNSNDGWVKIELGDTNENMHLFNLSKGVDVVYRIGDDSVSKGIPLEYNESITLDSDVYVLVKSVYGNISTIARLTRIIVPNE